MDKEKRFLALRDEFVEHVLTMVNDLEYIEQEDLFKLVNKTTKYSYTKIVEYIDRFNKLTTEILLQAFYSTNIITNQITDVCTSLIMINANLSSIKSTSETIRGYSIIIVLDSIKLIRSIFLSLKLK